MGFLEFFHFLKKKLSKNQGRYFDQTLTRKKNINPITKKTNILGIFNRLNKKNFIKKLKAFKTQNIYLNIRKNFFVIEIFINILDLKGL